MRSTESEFWKTQWSERAPFYRISCGRIAVSTIYTQLTVQGHSSIVFVIGGSLGLSEEVVRRADEQLSMSRMTFPHQLARVMLYEQIYRAMKISSGERYHK